MVFEGTVAKDCDFGCLPVVYSALRLPECVAKIMASATHWIFENRLNGDWEEYALL